MNNMKRQFDVWAIESTINPADEPTEQWHAREAAAVQYAGIHPDRWIQSGTFEVSSNVIRYEFNTPDGWAWVIERRTNPVTE